MTFSEADILACIGTKITRPGMGNEFYSRQGDVWYRGRYLGESSFTDMHAESPSRADRNASDWTCYIRERPDAWEGCDMPVPPRR